MNEVRGPILPAELTATGTALAQWQQWQIELPCKPEIVKTLGSGLSNRSYLLQAGETWMVLRLNNNHPHLPGIDRERESTIWQSAFEAGVAPALLHANPTYLVSAFVPDETFSPGETGKTWSRQDLTKADLAEEVFRLMKACHAIDVDVPEIDYSQHIQSYWAAIDSRQGENAGNELSIQRDAMQDVLATLCDLNQTTVLCHHDPVMANFVGSPERLYLIDWEYAARGLAVMDYAALAIEWGFSDAFICSHTQVRLDSLVMAKKLYRYMCQLWELSLVQKKPPPKQGSSDF